MQIFIFSISQSLRNFPIQLRAQQNETIKKISLIPYSPARIRRNKLKHQLLFLPECEKLVEFLPGCSKGGGKSLCRRRRLGKITDSTRGK